MKRLLRGALDIARADYCEVRFEDSKVLEIRFQGRALDRVSQEDLYGGNVRACHLGAWGFASFNDPKDLPAMVKAACEQARLAGERQGGTTRLAPVPVVDGEYAARFTLNPRQVTLGEKVRLLTRYQDLILGHDPAIAAASIRYFERTGPVYFANTEGTYVREDKVDIGASLGATARRGALTVSKGTGTGSSIGMDSLLDLDGEVREACSLAVQLLDAPQVKAGVYTVICDQDLAGLFVHEAFGHLSEADNAHKDPSLARTMTLGRRLGREVLTIYDSGEYSDRRGFYKYDDEGVGARRADLVREGVLVGRLHSRETAGVMGEQPTGSARALDYTHPPIVRMRSTCIAPGLSSFEHLMRDVELGLFALGSGGGQTNGEMFVFNATHGYMIRNGRRAELVRDVKLMGNVFTTLENIDLVGDLPRSRGGSGGCGKGGQGPLATSSNSPCIRIQNVIVGGAKQ